MNILIIDDDPDVVDVIKLTFNEIEHAHINAAHNEEDAKTFLSIMQLDLIILDLMMPGSSGFDICKRIRQNPNFDQTKILAITGYDTPEHKRAILASGANSYLAKPFTIAEFRSRIQTLFPQV